MNKSIAVLLTVHNRKEKTLSCLRGLFSQTIPNGYEIDVFLTDDGCTDGTPEAVNEEFPKVNIVKGDGNLFWNRGMYKAWEAASAAKDYDFYLWLNDDTDLSNEALVQLLNTSESFSDSAIIVGTTVSSKDSKEITYGGRDRRLNLVSPKDFPQECSTCNGNILLIPKMVYCTIGKNDVTFHHSLGDFDYGLRANCAKIKVIVAPGILGICDLHEKIDKWKDPSLPLSVRWKNFLSPTGANPFEYFKFKKRHSGIIMASMVFCSSILHVFIPVIWRLK